MVEEVLDGAAWGFGAVEDAGDDDGVVGGVVVAQHAAGLVGGPGEGGAAEEAVEEAGVEGLEDFFEVVVAAFGGGDALAAAGEADVLGSACHGFGGDVAAVAVGLGGADGLAIELGEEDVGDGVVDGGWGGFEEVGEADVEGALAQADGGVEGGEAAEADVEGGMGARGRSSRYSCSKMGTSVVGMLVKAIWGWGWKTGLSTGYGAGFAVVLGGGWARNQAFCSSIRVAADSWTSLRVSRASLRETV